MVSKKIVIHHPLGLHARPAALLVQTASRCSSDVWLINGEKCVNGKSILNILAAAITDGTEIELRCQGERENEDLEVLANFLENELRHSL